MFYSPHILQVKVSNPLEKDEFGRPVPVADTEEWQDVCKCRCDDNSTKEFTSENGQAYRPNYHVVCEKNMTVKAGQEVRCMSGGVVRGIGTVYMVKNLNYLSYSELWM